MVGCAGRPYVLGAWWLSPLKFNEYRINAFQFIDKYINKNGIWGSHRGNVFIKTFDWLQMAWHQPQTSIPTLMQLSGVMLRTKNDIFNAQNCRNTAEFQIYIYIDLMTRFLIVWVKLMYANKDYDRIANGTILDLLAHVLPFFFQCWNCYRRPVANFALCQ